MDPNNENESDYIFDVLPSLDDVEKSKYPLNYDISLGELDQLFGHESYLCMEGVKSSRENANETVLATAVRTNTDILHALNRSKDATNENKKRRVSLPYILTPPPPKSHRHLLSEKALCLPLCAQTSIMDIPEVYALCDARYAYAVNIHGAPMIPSTWSVMNIDLVIGCDLIPGNGNHNYVCKYNLGVGAFIFAQRLVFGNDPSEIGNMKIQTMKDIVSYFPDCLLVNMLISPGEDSGNVYIFVHRGVHYKLDYLRNIIFIWIIGTSKCIIPANTTLAVDHTV